MYSWSVCQINMVWRGKAALINIADLVKNHYEFNLSEEFELTANSQGALIETHGGLI